MRNGTFYIYVNRVSTKMLCYDEKEKLLDVEDFGPLTEEIETATK